MKWTKERATCGKESCISFILCQHYNIRNCENAIMNQCQPESSQYQQCMSILHQSIMWCDSIKCKKKIIILLLLFKISNAYFVASWINSSINLLTLKQVSQNIFIWFTVELSIFSQAPGNANPIDRFDNFQALGVQAVLCFDIDLASDSAYTRVCHGHYYVFQLSTTYLYLLLQFTIDFCLWSLPYGDFIRAITTWLSCKPVDNEVSRTPFGLITCSPRGRRWEPKQFRGPSIAPDNESARFGPIMNIN